MIELDLAEGEPVSVQLDLRVIRGRPAPSAPFRLDGRIAVGRPHIRRLTPSNAGSDTELARFIESESSAWDYFLTALSCTFISDDDQRLATAWLRLTLTSSDDGHEPIAYSMDPLVLEEIRALPFTIKLTVPCVISSEVALQGERDRREIAVQALYEGTSKPTWTFAETSAKRLNGVQRLRLVIRRPAGQQAKGRIELGATIRQRRLGTDALSYFLPLTDLPEPLRFELPS